MEVIRHYSQQKTVIRVGVLLFVGVIALYVFNYPGSGPKDEYSPAQLISEFDTDCQSAFEDHVDLKTISHFLGYREGVSNLKRSECFDVVKGEHIGFVDKIKTIDIENNSVTIEGAWTQGKYRLFSPIASLENSEKLAYIEEGKSYNFECQIAGFYVESDNSLDDQPIRFDACTISTLNATQASEAEQS